MEKKSKLFMRACAYAERAWKEGDEPTLITFRARKTYQDAAREERALLRKRFRENLEALKDATEKTRKLLDELEELVSPHSD